MLGVNPGTGPLSTSPRFALVPASLLLALVPLPPRETLLGFRLVDVPPERAPSHAIEAGDGVAFVLSALRSGQQSDVCQDDFTRVGGSGAQW